MNREKDAKADLKPCPNCGKRAGVVVKSEIPTKFPYLVRCNACGFTTGMVRLESIAVKLWNDAKLPKGAKAKRERR